MIYWMIGLSGSGKTTLANTCNCITLDGDEIRNTINKELGFSIEDRHIHLKRICGMAKGLNNIEDVIVSTITPTIEIREYIKEQLGDSVAFIYIKADIETCSKRDPKGLYKEKYQYMTGVGSRFDIPDNPDYIIDTQNQTLEESSIEINNIIRRNV